MSLTQAWTRRFPSMSISSLLVTPSALPLLLGELYQPQVPLLFGLSLLETKMVRLPKVYPTKSW